MAHYAIGDLQGCYTELNQLLQLIDFNYGTDTLWLVGDIVNRGTHSLECLQFCMAHESSVQIVLGNHDLHLLAVSYGFGKLKQRDTLDSILNHPHLPKMRDWLRHQPLLRHNHTHVLVHAGLLPEWSVNQSIELSEEVQDVLRRQPHDYFAGMYGNQPSHWQPDWHGGKRWRFITNVLTRMRVLTKHHHLDYDFKGQYADIPPPHLAWFDADNRAHRSHKIVFGHWSALGFLNDKGVIALDTGALWGGQLTAINLADERVFQVNSSSQNDWEHV